MIVKQFFVDGKETGLTFDDIDGFGLDIKGQIVYFRGEPHRIKSIYYGKPGVIYTQYNLEEVKG